MQNLIDTIKSLISEHVISEPKIPLHTGEVMNIWTFYTFVDEAKRYSQMALNHTSDKELAHMLEDVVFNMEDKMVMKLKEFMISNGVPLPDVTAQKPITDPMNVPLGAKMTDSEIANGLALKISGGILLCARGQAESIRDDVGMMFTEFHAQKLVFGLKVKKLLAKRGWLKSPPYYYAPGIPIQRQ
jgi:hypothetical protein